MTIRRNQQKIKVCESCFSRKEPTQQKSGNTGNYVRKVFPAKGGGFDHPGANYEEHLADVNGKVEKNTMTCEKCQKECSQGYVAYSKAFFCKECGQKNSCSKEFEWLIEELQKSENKPQRTSPQSNRTKYLCEGCKQSCWKDKGDSGAGYYRKRIRHWDLNFNETVNYFCLDGDYGALNKKDDSKCAEEFKKNYLATCAKCQKREWPDMAKGWSLDYGLNKIFCSSMCHMLYHKALWEQENPKSKDHKETKIPSSVVEKWTEKVKLFPGELELSSDGEKEFDWDKEIDKKELLTLKAIDKVLMKSEISSQEVHPDVYQAELGQLGQINKYINMLKEEEEKWNSIRKSDSIPRTDMDREYEKAIKEMEEERFGSYRNSMFRNSFRNSQQAYADKYGKNELNALLSSKQQVQPPKKANRGLIIGVGLIAIGGVVGGLIYYFWNKKKAQK